METQRQVVQPVSSRKWQMAKIALQSASLAFCAAVIGISAGTFWGGNYWPGMLMVPVAAATAAWTIAEFVTLLVRRKRRGGSAAAAAGRGIHPGAHVGVQLIIFLAMIYVLFYLCMLWVSVQRSVVRCNEWERDPRNPDWVVEGHDDDDDLDVSRHSGGYTTSYYCPESRRVLVNSKSFQSAVQALIALCGLLWAIHFTLFVRACVETQRRNRLRPAGVVYPQPAWPAPYGANYPPNNNNFPQAGPGHVPSSEARLYTFSQETKDHLRKFRLTTSRASGPQAVIYYIDKKTYEIKQDDDKVVYKSLDEIADDLPDNTPRYILLSYPLTLPSGRMSVPYVLLYYLPNTCNAESRMMYAGAKELMRNTAEVGKVIDVESPEDLEDIPNKLSAE
ncbi:uncharacterized protein F4812DRAFT_456335 [Daldinia caldariorum]|uniref:uncharacterized protein n=1 Tax=Daldinia caldariorum TaxID=326644 RepID=UPI0020077C1A|nr:uncharacterized protein F4812DRAFT_456335 [Daldinia caldariorum]KAI1470329.1 hypothetical protein F4812DRAFT_456335 [Daldinia caldariorum]